MSETNEVMGCLTEIRDSVFQLGGEVKQLGQRFDEMSQRFDEMNQRMDKVEHRLDKVDQRLDKVDQRLDKMDQRFDEFDERLNNMEFVLETEIQKVYEIALANQANIEYLMFNQKRIYNELQMSQQLTDLNERVDVVEDVVQSHSKAIHNLQNAIA